MFLNLCIITFHWSFGFPIQVKDEHVSESTHLVQLVIDYMKSKGIDILCQAEGKIFIFY